MEQQQQQYSGLKAQTRLARISSHMLSSPQVQFLLPLSLDLGQFCDAGISRNFAKFCLYTCVWILFAYGSSVMICFSSIFLMMIYPST